METKRQVVIYSVETGILDDQTIYDRVKAYISPERLARAMRMYREKDQRLSILSEMLISYAYSVRGLSPHPVLLTGEHGKPFDQDDQLHFNVSHSGNRVVLAVTDNAVEIGCDIQKITKCDIRIAERMFSVEETERLVQVQAVSPGEDADLLFTKMWTRKESFLKCIGIGLAASNTQPDERFCFEELNVFAGYHCTVCLKTEEPFLIRVIEPTADMLEATCLAREI